MRSDGVLVEIFALYINLGNRRMDPPRNTWHKLVHVCRRWRYLVLASPRHLNLRLEYGGHRPISEVLDAWPVLPVTLIPTPFTPLDPKWGKRWYNRLTALQSEHYNRICEIQIFNLSISWWERFAAAMQKPFPELTRLEVWVDDGDEVAVLPDSFLGGSAPRLRELILVGIPCPSIPKLLLSANGLVTLSLEDIPDYGYFSPDAMATALKVMTRLESLKLRFCPPQFPPDPESRPLPPNTRFVLPVLTQLTFEGVVHKYLEDLLARINTPLLDYLDITFSGSLNFNLPQLHRLIGHAEEFKTFDYARLLIFDDAIQLDLHPKTGTVDDRRHLQLQINCEELDWQILSLTRLCSSSLPFTLTSALEALQIEEDDLFFLQGKDAQWQKLLDPFTALTNLYLPNTIALPLLSGLLELSGERVTEVLPALQNLFIYPGYLPENSQKAIKMFVAARRRSGHSVSVHCGSRSEGWSDITEDLASRD